MTNEEKQQPVLEVLHQAAGVHARQRALLFLLRSALWLIVLIPVVMVADVLGHFSGAVRLAGSLAVVGAGLVVVAVAIGMACFARPPLLRVARLLESRNPAIGSRLVNILQLNQDAANNDAAPLTRELARQAVAAAGESLELAALPQLAREPEVPRRIRPALAAAALLALLTFLGGQHVHDQWLRFLDPFGDHPPFSLTRLEILKPAEGDKVLFGASALVEVRASGHQPRELFLTAKSLDGSGVPVLLPLAPRGDGTFAVRLENLRQAVELTVHTADRDTLSHRRQLDLILTPQIGPARVRLIPPAYTGQPARELPYRFTALQALEGTEIEFFISSNRPMGAGSLVLETADGALVPPLALGPATEGPADTATARITAQQSGRLVFNLVDVANNPAAADPAAVLTITKDLPPALAITAPDSDALVVAGLTVPIIVEASDDYGLSSLRLHISVNDKFLPPVGVAFADAVTRRHRLEHLLDLAALGALAGDKVAVFAEVIDTRPDPQITRSDLRRFEVITEEDYNDRLREQADVALLAGKYEALLQRLDEKIQAQRQIEESLAEMLDRVAANPGDPKLLDDFSAAVAEQAELNKGLAQLAERMENFGRENPLYDFENGLQEELAQEAGELRESAAQNQQDLEKALENGPPPPATPGKEVLQDAATAARAQRERLEGSQEQAEKEVLEPLADLAQLHELMKDFKQFGEAAAEQEQLAAQSKAYEDKPQLNAEDRLALRDMGNRQRDLARQLEQLADKLNKDAEAAEEKFPEAAASAKELAAGIQQGSMPGLAREAAQNLLDGKAGDGHAEAQNLHEQMQQLMAEAGQPGQDGTAQGLDRALSARSRMKPGDSLRQMMLSRRFRMPGSNQGGAGTGTGGMMAAGTTEGKMQLLGGESLQDGPIANELGGRGDKDGQGQGGGPAAQLDRADQSEVDAESARRTAAPAASSLLFQYENIADAYFRRLTTKP